MKFTTAASTVALLVLLASAIRLCAADTPTVTVIGYVLDSARAFTKSLANPSASNAQFPVQTQAHSSSFSPTMELFTGRSLTPRHQVGRTLSFYRLLETK
jgi:hypothetical protein